MEAARLEDVWGPSGSLQGWFARLGRSLRIGTYGILSDERLVRRTRARDHWAFDALAARYRDRLYALALHSLGDEAAAGDALCETMISAFRDIDSIGPKCNPGTWFYLHGIRVVIRRMKVPPGRYTVESRPAARVTSPADD